MASCENCPLEHRLNTLEERFSGALENNRQTHSDLYSQINALTITYTEFTARTDEKLNKIMELLRPMEKKLDEIVLEPGKRWKSLVSSVLAAIGGAVLGAIIGRIGL